MDENSRSTSSNLRVAQSKYDGKFSYYRLVEPTIHSHVIFKSLNGDLKGIGPKPYSPLDPLSLKAKCTYSGLKPPPIEQKGSYLVSNPSKNVNADKVEKGYRDGEESGFCEFMDESLSKEKFEKSIAIISNWYNKFPIIKSKKESCASLRKRSTILPDDKKPVLIETVDGLDVRFNLSILIEILTCYLCKGLFYNAHTIRDCMHTFCKSCLILSTFENGLVCPICFTFIHSNILEGIEFDHNIQGIVDKLFPKFMQDERSEIEKIEDKVKSRRRKELQKGTNLMKINRVTRDLGHKPNFMKDSTLRFLNELNNYPNLSGFFGDILSLALVHESDNQIRGLFDNIKYHIEDFGDLYYSDIPLNYPRKYICVPKRVKISDIGDYLVRELVLEPKYHIVFLFRNSILKRSYTIEFVFQSFQIDMSKCLVFRYKILLEPHI